MWAAVLAGGLLASTAWALDVSLEPYREARGGGALGVVSGKVLAEPRTPTALPRPLTGTVVTLLPRSGPLRAGLERLKEQSRESSTSFTAAAPEMRKAKEHYERDLLEAGAPDLALSVQVDHEGAFRFDDVPAGPWVLLAWHGEPVNVSTLKPRGKDRKLYQPHARLQGYQAVTVWLLDVAVTGHATATVELSGRNAWFRGVVEDRVLDAGR
jgi:hypothetical protein